MFVLTVLQNLFDIWWYRNLTKKWLMKFRNLEHRKIIFTSEIWNYILQIWCNRRFVDTIPAEERRKTIGRKM